MQWLASPDKPHLHGSQPTNASLTANSTVILPPVCSSGCSLLYSERRCTRYPGVHSFSANTKPNGLRRILPVPHRFKEFQALSLPSSFPVPWLLPDPSSSAFPSLSQFLALMDPLVLCYLPWAVRLTAGGAGGMEDGRRCGLRLPSAGCIAACKSSSSQCPPMSQVAYAEGRQGADQIGKICVDPPQGRGQREFSSYMQDSKMAREVMH